MWYSFFQSILTACPEDVEEVIVEADGEWHTEDSKYGSASWMANRPKEAPSVKASPAPFSRKQSSTVEPPDRKPNGDGADPNVKKKEPEVFVLDDDDTDDGDVPLAKSNPMLADNAFDDRRATSYNLTPGTQSVPRQTPVLVDGGVIDLTGFDSEDEDRAEESRPPPSNGVSHDIITAGPSRLPNSNGYHTNQNGATKRRREDDLIGGIFGSDSDSDHSDSYNNDREDMLFDPNRRGRRVEYDEQDQVAKRARLSESERSTCAAVFSVADHSCSP